MTSANSALCFTAVAQVAGLVRVEVSAYGRIHNFVENGLEVLMYASVYCAFSAVFVAYRA